MMWRCVGLVITLSAAGVPQDPPRPDGDALFKELKEKVDASMPISAKMSLESVDGKGVKSVRFKVKLHLRLKEGWVYSETQLVGSDEPALCNVLDGNRYVMSWQKGGAGRRLDVRLTFNALWGSQWRHDQERRKVLEDPDPHKTFEVFAASRRFVLHLQLDPDKDEAAFRFALGASETGGANWLQAVREAGKVAATPDTVTVTETEIPRTTVIDRRTGFVRSIRLDLPSGVAKIVSISDVAVKAAHPDLVFPGTWEDRSGRISDALKMVGPMLRAEATSSVAELLKRWSEAGSEDRAEALRGYLAWMAAEFDALNREASRLEWADHFVKKAVEGGATLDQLSRGLDVQSKRFGDQVRTMEADAKQAAIWTERVIQFRQELEKAAADSPGADDARKTLVRRIQEGFEADRIRKAVPSLGAPDCARILREAIDAARDGEAK